MRPSTAPVGVYDYQHYDARFFMESEQWWWGEQYPPASSLASRKPGTPACAEGTIEAMYQAAQPVPIDCWPGSPMAVANVGHYTWGQGIHLYNLEEAGWQAYAQGTSTGKVDSLTYGMQAGEIAYVETMFSRDDALQPDVTACFDMTSTVPKHFNTERAFPTRKCLISNGGPTFKVQYDNFVTVPGGCKDMKNDTLIGWFPPDMISLYGYGCKVRTEDGTDAVNPFPTEP